MQRVKHNLVESNNHYIKDAGLLAAMMKKTASMIEYDVEAQ